MAKAAHEMEEEKVIDRSTLLIEIATNEYPLYMRDLSSRINVSFGNTVYASVLERYGYAAVELADPPQGDVVTEVTPVKTDGVYRQTYVVREFTEEEKTERLDYAKANKLDSIKIWAWEQFEKGVPYQFSDGLYHVQCRAEDKANILACYIRAKERVETGIDKNFSCRTYEDKTVVLSPIEMVAMAGTYLEKIEEGYVLIWNIKDQVKEATSLEDFPEIPEELFEL